MTLVTGRTLIGSEDAACELGNVANAELSRAEGFLLLDFVFVVAAAATGTSDACSFAVVSQLRSEMSPNAAFHASRTGFIA